MKASQQGRAMEGAATYNRSIEDQRSIWKVHCTDACGLTSRRSHTMISPTGLPTPPLHEAADKIVIKIVIAAYGRCEHGAKASFFVGNLL
ncbi:hypothetical protein QJS10_CPA05g01219 [Acorus calamus]|uniref:Uncharacterized protein n=1 Tax=Acorus calamus TaxID=4465 RepID=A0AAV9EU89_ACOCL|nr:hypothetical protein QJS10_CPA05g01219 [Acorus calamus]